MNHKDIGDRKKNDDIPESPSESNSLTTQNAKKDPTEKINQFGREYDII